MKVMITQKLGKMNKVDGIGIGVDGEDLSMVYNSLWLPEAGMTKIEELR